MFFFVKFSCFGIQFLQVALSVFLLIFDVIAKNADGNMASNVGGAVVNGAFVLIPLFGFYCIYAYRSNALLVYSVGNLIWIGANIYFLLFGLGTIQNGNDPIQYAQQAAIFFAAKAASTAFFSTLFTGLQILFALLGFILSLLVRKQYLDDEDDFDSYDGFHYF